MMRGEKEVANLVIFWLYMYISCPIVAPVTKMIKSFTGPKYDGKYLHSIVREKLGDIRLHQTLTNVVIPTFDIRKLQPTIFSSYEVSLLTLLISVLMIKHFKEYFTDFSWY